MGWLILLLACQQEPTCGTDRECLFIHLEEAHHYAVESGEWGTVESIEDALNVLKRSESGSPQD